MLWKITEKPIAKAPSANVAMMRRETGGAGFSLASLARTEKSCSGSSPSSGATSGSSLTPIVSVGAKCFNGSSTEGKALRRDAKSRIAPQLRRSRVSSAASFLSEPRPCRQKRFKGPSEHSIESTFEISPCSANATAVFFIKSPASKSRVSTCAGADRARFLTPWCDRLLNAAISASCSAKLFGCLNCGAVCVRCKVHGMRAGATSGNSTSSTMGGATSGRRSGESWIGIRPPIRPGAPTGSLTPPLFATTDRRRCELSSPPVMSPLCSCARMFGFSPGRLRMDGEMGVSSTSELRFPRLVGGD
mmetsp:Transcript_78605/g.159811  ORF Transcript_78605/g.159811 Transcript_78605/m.159811 type:complete len:304 (+) Transcript_78605:2171-3082(+)